MDPPGLLSPRTRLKGVFIMIYLLGSALCSETDSSCTCTTIPQCENDNIQKAMAGCFPTNGTFRHKCMDGFVRQAGSSNLVRCLKSGNWLKCTLVCIRNPLIPPQTTTERTSTPLLTSPLTPTLALFSTESAETTPLEPTSTTLTTLPPQFTTGAPLERSALPHTHSNTPSSPPVSSTAPVTAENFHSSPTTTHTPRRRLDTITPPSGSFLNSTSSTQQGTDALVGKVVAPVAVVIIVAAVLGAVWLLRRRKSRERPQRNGREPRSEEDVPMNQIQKYDVSLGSGE